MKYLYLIYHWLIAAPILLVLTMLTAIVTIIGAQFNDDWWGYYPPKWWCMAWCTLLGVRVVVKNREKIDAKTQYVFVANHQGAFDIFSIYGFLGHRFKWMMRKGLTNIPLVGTACRAAGHILVDHSSASAVKKTMGDAQKKLERGNSIVVFPEGRRSDDGHLQPFKHGAFRLATMFRRPIVPISIDGSYKVMPRGSWHAVPGTITLTIHDPILPPEKGRHDLNEITERCYETIKSALAEQEQNTDSHEDRTDTATQ